MPGSRAAVGRRCIDRVLMNANRVPLAKGSCAFGHPGPGREHDRGFDYEYHTVQNEFRGVLCAECRSWYLDPRPSEQQFSVIYPERYTAYEMTGAAGRPASLAFRAKARLEALKIRGYARSVRELGGDVLDVGCGDGLLLDGFRRAGFSRERLIGVDVHPRAVELARAKGYEVIEGAFESAAVGESRYCLVVMNQLIEHVIDPLLAVKKLRNILVPGGFVFLETPNIGSPNARLARRRYWGGYHYPRHLHLFTPGTITELLSRAGLEVVKVKFIPCPVQWILTINNFLQERRHPPAFLLRLTDWKNPLLLALFTALDVLLLPLGTANMQVIARRPGGGALVV